MATRKTTRKPSSTYPVVCGECCELADQAAITQALRRGTAYVHGCGRVLVRELSQQHYGSAVSLA